MKNKQEMISEFQCPGCILGSDPCQECPSFSLSEEYGFNCTAHSAGTMSFPGGFIYLGLPRGFNKVGAFVVKGNTDPPTHNIRLWITPDSPEWDHFNVPVWAMEQDGHLFVRTYMPRTNRNSIDVIKGGTFEMLPDNTINVAEFVGEID